MQGLEVTRFSFIVGILGRVLRSSELSGTIGQRMLSGMGPWFEIPACTAWGHGGTLIAPSFGLETV